MNEIRYVLRGGSFYLREYIRSTFRVKNLPHRRVDVYGFRVVVNGVGEEFARRVLRGGTFYYDKEDARCALCNCYNLYHRYYDSGFRVVANRVGGK